MTRTSIRTHTDRSRAARRAWRTIRAHGPAHYRALRAWRTMRSRAAWSAALGGSLPA